MAMTMPAHSFCERTVTSCMWLLICQWALGFFTMNLLYVYRNKNINSRIPSKMKKIVVERTVDDSGVEFVFSVIVAVVLSILSDVAKTVFKELISVVLIVLPIIPILSVDVIVDITVVGGKFMVTLVDKANSALFDA